MHDGSYFGIKSGTYLECECIAVLKRGLDYLLII